MQNHAKLVSVIIPFYNGARFIKDAINSILNQGVENIEIILVNDGSTDNSVEVLNEISNNNIRLIHQENAGAAEARNNGVRHAIGKYIAFLDADDIWEKNKLKLQLEVITSTNAPKMVFGHVCEFFDQSLPNHQSLQSTAKTFVGYSPIAMLITKEDFLSVGEFHGQWKVAEFIDWYDRAKHVGLSEEVLPNVVANRRIHAGNMDRLERPDSKQYVAVLKAALDRRRNSQN
jgi:glycosyltransferase involved in cell wall biosynthesis